MSWTEIQDLRAQRQHAVHEAGKISTKVAAEKRDWTAEENAKFEELHNAANKLQEREQHLVTQMNAEKSASQLIGREDISSEARSKNDILTRAYVKKVTSQSMDEAEKRALASAGSAFVPDSFSLGIVQIIKDSTSILNANPNVIRTEDGRPFPVGIMNDTNVGELIGENAAPAFVDPGSSSVNLGAYQFSSKGVKVSQAAVEDYQPGFIENIIVPSMGGRLSRTLNTYLTTGTGSSQPEGLFYAAANGKTAASATAITYYEVLDLMHSVAAQYRNFNDCVFMGKDSTLLLLRKLLDGSGNPLWNAGNISDAFTDKIAGYRYVTNNDCPAATTGLKSLGFGNVKAAFTVRMVKDIQFASAFDIFNLQYLWVGHVRMDSKIVDNTAFKVLTQA